MTIMTTKLKFKIVTPDRVMYDGEVDQVTLPTQMGQVTIMPNHIPLISSLSAGELRIVESGTEKLLAVGGGVLEVRTDNEIVILADVAEHEEEIDLKRAEEARERAQKIMREKVLSDAEYAQTAAALEKSLARIRVGSRRKHRKVHTPESIS